MERSTTLALSCLAAFLVLFPLTLVKPGWPVGLKADEPAYYLMALSLAHDLVEKLDNEVPAALQIEMSLESIRMLERATRWFLRHSGRPFDVSGLVSRATRPTS